MNIRRVPSLPTRNGNRLLLLLAPVQVQVPSLPTRNGNPGACANTICSPSFPAYLQGMETDLAAVAVLAILGFPAYLQGMETDPGGAQAVLPLRSQPTYKEWKLV